MWTLIVFSVFMASHGDTWQADRGTSMVIPGFSSKETCIAAGKEFKTDELPGTFSRFEERQSIRLKHRFQCVEVK